MFRRAFASPHARGLFVPKAPFSYSFVIDDLRFFLVNYQFPEDIQYKIGNFQAEHFTHLQKAEDSGSLLLAGKKVGSHGYLMLFRCKDERVPFDFIKSDPYYSNNLVEKYTINEIEIPQQTEHKELAAFNLFR